MLNRTVGYFYNKDVGNFGRHYCGTAKETSFTNIVCQNNLGGQTNMLFKTSLTLHLKDDKDIEFTYTEQGDCCHQFQKLLKIFLLNNDAKWK